MTKPLSGQKKQRKKPTLLHKIVLLFHTLVMGSLCIAYLAPYVNPAKFWVLAFFGLALLPLLFVNIGFILYWLFANRKYAFLGLLVIALGYPVLKNLFAYNGTKNTIENSDIKLLSWNVRLFDLYNWTNNTKTRNHMFGLIDSSQADIFCFQEFYYREPGKIKFETRDTLKTIIGTNNITEGYTHHIKGGQHFGLITFSKLPIIHSGIIRFESDPNNLCIYTDVLSEKDTIRIYNAHLSSIRFSHSDYKYFDEFINYGEMQDYKTAWGIVNRIKNAFLKRIDQANQIKAHMNACPHPVVLCGDFNDTPASHTYYLLSKELNDAFLESGKGLGSTYQGRFPGLRIDYGLHSKRLKGSYFKRHKVKYSDHYPISFGLNKIQ